MKKKAMALVLALGLVVVGIVSGTMAWLTAQATKVENVFTPSDINITLSEDTKAHNETTDYRFKMVPGDIFAKDPKVKVETGSEACWLFVAITESSNLDTFISYDVADGWTQLKVTKDNVTTEYENIYYRNVTTGDIGKDFYILKGNTTYPNGCVSVKDSVTKTHMEAIKTANQPTLTFDACAVQSAHLESIEAAWENADGTFKTLAVVATPATGT